MRDKVHHIKACYPLLVQEKYRMRVFFAVDSNQYVSASHFFFTWRLHMQDGTLNYALEAKRWLCINLICTVYSGSVFLDIAHQLWAQIIKICTTRAQNISRSRVIYHRKQQVLDRDKFVPLLARIHKGHM